MNYFLWKCRKKLIPLNMLCACGSGKYVEKGKHGGLSDLKVLKKKFTHSGEIQCQDFYHITE